MIDKLVDAGLRRTGSRYRPGSDSGRIGTRASHTAVSYSPCRWRPKRLALRRRGASQHRQGQLRLGPKLYARADAGRRAPCPVLGSGPRQMQLLVDERSPGRGGVGKEHSDLGSEGSPRSVCQVPYLRAHQLPACSAAEPAFDHRRNACPSSMTVGVALAGPRVDPPTGDPFRLLDAGRGDWRGPAC